MPRAYATVIYALSPKGWITAIHCTKASLGNFSQCRTLLCLLTMEACYKHITSVLHTLDCLFAVFTSTCSKPVYGWDLPTWEKGIIYLIVTGVHWDKWPWSVFLMGIHVRCVPGTRNYSIAVSIGSCLYTTSPCTVNWGHMCWLSFLLYHKSHEDPKHRGRMLGCEYPIGTTHLEKLQLLLGK